MTRTNYNTAKKLVEQISNLVARLNQVLPEQKKQSALDEELVNGPFFPKENI